MAIFLSSVFTWFLTNLVGSALMRIFVRFSLFFSMSYFGELIIGASGGLLPNIINPQVLMNDFGDTAFGPQGIVSWGNYFLYLTDIWVPLRYFLYAAASWFLTKLFVINAR